MSCQHKLFSRILAFNRKVNLFNWGGGSNCKFWEKKPQSYFIVIRECSRYEFAH